MSNDASFVGNIPEHYDRGLGPLIFVDYAADIARRVAACSPARVLETAAGTGIVTRQLRDLVPTGMRLTATDLNPPMLEVARAKFRLGEQVDFRPADATALPFPDGSFDVVVCQFGVMFFPEKDKSYRESSMFGTRIATTHSVESRMKSPAPSFPLIRLSSTRCPSRITRLIRSRNP
jgi:SAM-dependent methyltransferase